MVLMVTPDEESCFWPSHQMQTMDNVSSLYLYLKDFFLVRNWRWMKEMNFLVAQTKRMTTKLRLPSRFNAASLATNLTTTTMYTQSQNGIILNLVRSLHD